MTNQIIKRLALVVDDFISQHGGSDRVTCATFKMFLTVCQNEGSNQKDLARAAGYSIQQASRTLINLDKTSKGGKNPGMHLVDGTRSLENDREKAYVLTTKGRQYKDRMITLLEDK